MSTFPFLAVLLGAMGALILLLLVMDRRSKIVARNKAIAAHAAQVAVRARERDHHVQDAQARRAEWELKRGELHDMLHRQEQELTRESQSLFASLKARGDDLQKETSALADLENRLLEQRDRLDVKSQLLAQLRQGIARSAQRDTASQLEAEKLARELAQLERGVHEAKMLKTQAQETYSLVPYRGRLGESRRPVYVECTEGAVVFRPDGPRLDTANFDIRAFRDEVQRRGVELAREKSAGDGPSLPPLQRAPTTPYVLFLVRPDGLESYYHATTALRGFDLDFGYELIDAQWVLDFAQGSLPSGQQAALQERPLKSSSRDRGQENVFAAHDPPPPSLALGTGQASGAMAEVRQDRGLAHGPSGGSGKEQIGLGPPDLGPSGVQITPRSGLSTGGLPGDAKSGPGRMVTLNGPGNGSRSESSAYGGGRPRVAVEDNTSGAQSYRSGSTPSGSALNSGQQAPRGNSGNLSDAPGSTAVISQSIPATGQPGQGQNPQDIPWRGSSASASARAPNGMETAKGAGGPASGQGGAGGEGGTASADDPFPRRTPGLPFADPRPGPRKLAPVSSVGRLLGSRDYVLTIECFQGAVAVHPSHQVFSVASGGNQGNSDEALVQAVRQLIARRQATVGSGETPYRPMLRFQVHPEALRTYLHVYPLFENLRIPMARENLDS